MSEYYNLGRVSSIDDVNELVWIEFSSGARASVERTDLPTAGVGSYIYASNDLSDVCVAPEGVRWARPFRTIGTLVSLEKDRALLSVAGQVRGMDADAVKMPVIGHSYVFEDSSQAWEPLSPAEDNVILGLNSEDSVPFTVETLSPKDGGAASVGGLDSKLQELTRLVRSSFSSRAELGVSDSKPISGAIFFGPAGTGKTHLARAVAQETEAQLITVNGPELVSKWVGATERILRDLFALADKYERSVIFFDEFDTIGARRSPDSHDFVNRQVGQLLATMDGINRSRRPFVIAATNRLEDVDPAFLRPGRFDYPMEFTVPTGIERLEILRAQSRKQSIPEEVLHWMAASSNGWTPAELGLIWTEAEAVRRAEELSVLTLEHLTFGFEKAKAQHSLIERTRDSWALTEKNKE